MRFFAKPAKPNVFHTAAMLGFGFMLGAYAGGNHILAAFGFIVGICFSAMRVVRYSQRPKSSSHAYSHLRLVRRKEDEE